VGCSIGVRVCNFTKEKGEPRFHQGVHQEPPFLNKFFVWSDDLIRYGLMKNPRKYWERPLNSG